MQGNRVRAMMTFIVLLGLAGCKPDIPKVILTVNGLATTKPDVHTMVRSRTDVTWHADSQPFWVVFDAAHNPCDPSIDTHGSNVYAAVQQPSGAWEAKCTMAKRPVGKPPYGYYIYSSPPPPGTTEVLSGHCEGCIIDE
jgi:hypothetical protein